MSFPFLDIGDNEMYPDPTIEVDGYSLFSADDKKPTEIANGEYAFPVKGYGETYTILMEKLNSQIELQADLWIDGNKISGEIVSISREGLGWIIRFKVTE